MYEIAAIAVAAIAAASIVGFTVQMGISPMPSSVRACRAMLAAAADAPSGPIVDLGSGWGTLAVLFAARFPKRRVIGYEMSWVPWIVSCLLKHLLGLRNLSFHRVDFRHAPLPFGGVLLCYLYRRGMQDVSRRLDRDRGGPRLVISNTFALPWFREDEVITLDDVYRTRIYVYRIGPSPLTRATASAP